MDVIDKVRELISLMSSNELAELEVEQPELKIRIKKLQPPHIITVPQQMAAAPPGAFPYPPPMLDSGQASSTSLAPTKQKAEEESAEAGLVEVTSPMVGTFYRASSPGADPYVEDGTSVEPDTVVCIIEAMKVMNEIKAEVTGDIVERCVEDAQPVEFGQVLFLVRPSSI